MAFSLWDTLKNVAQGFFHGIKDSILGFFRVYYYDKPKLERQNHATERVSVKSKQIKTKEENDDSQSVKADLKYICRASGLMYGVTLFAFYFLLLPTLSWLQNFVLSEEYSGIFWSRTRPLIVVLFYICWVVPMFLILKIINFFLYQNVARNAYQQRQGKLQSSISFGTMVADNIFSCFVQMLFLIQVTLISVLPFPSFINVILAYLHMSLLNALYSFEYNWTYRGWNLDRRLRFIEVNWPYFLGFGFIPSLVSLYPSLLLSAFLYTVLFPFFIISANEAVPYCANNGCALKLFVFVFFIANKIAQQLAKTGGSGKHHLSSR